MLSSCRINWQLPLKERIECFDKLLRTDKSSVWGRAGDKKHWKSPPGSLDKRCETHLEIDNGFSLSYNYFHRDFQLTAQQYPVPSSSKLSSSRLAHTLLSEGVPCEAGSNHSEVCPAISQKALHELAR
jgi:hypothetical protein